MLKLIKIDKNLQIPIYQQIVDRIIDGIERKDFKTNDQIPSINQIANHNKLARETVIKAFRALQERGIIKAIHGKGFFIASQEVLIEHRVFVLFDTLSAYKEVMYHAIKKHFGEKAFIDIYFHHFNSKVFKQLIVEAAGNYTDYLILPFDDRRITEMLEPIPYDKLVLVDRYPQFYKKKYIGVWQDFKNDVIRALSSAKALTKKYQKLILVFRNVLTQLPVELREGFELFCAENSINYEVNEKSLRNHKLQKGEAFIVIDDEDLVLLVEKANNTKLKIGEDIGIISYNETSLKKVIAGGISVISTDFEKMGKKVVEISLSNEKTSIKNPCRFINRGSF